MKKSLILSLLALAAIAFTGCKGHDGEPQLKGRNLVVYGKIFTADNNAIADAFAVENGKFVYVGDAAGAKKYKRRGFTVIDHTDKGIVIPGCYESHAHYLMGSALTLMGGAPSIINEYDTLIEMIKTAYTKAKAEGKSSICGFGWGYQIFALSGAIPTRQELDSLCPDVALFVCDSEIHKGIANTLCLQNAGILDKDGKVLISKIRGGEICMDTANKPTGLLKEQAATYVRVRGLNFEEIFPTSVAMAAIEHSQKQLLANGYISYMDGWTNVFGTNALYDAAKALDKDDRLHMLLGLGYDIESSCENVNDEIGKAIQKKQYTGGHVNADFVKLFIDGTVETGTGFTTEEYQADRFGYGVAIWEEDEVTDITRAANANGMTMHIHTMGDAAVHRAVNAFVNGGKKELRNTVVHTRNVMTDDYRRMADNNIVAVSGMYWHNLTPLQKWILDAVVPVNLIGKAYPIKSYFDAHVVATAHSDYPASAKSPIGPFEIMQIAITGKKVADGEDAEPFEPAELISREQALQSLTINGAYQMHVENERGSIQVGKYADFVLVNQDILTCPATDIYQSKVVATYFEGKQVYPNN